MAINGGMDAVPYSSPAVVANDGSNTIQIDDSRLLFTGDYFRLGDDLLIAHQGESLLIPEYFGSEVSPNLVAPNGAYLTGDVVNSLAGPQSPGEYAQAGSMNVSVEIGKIIKLSGSATAKHASGIEVNLAEGDPVFQGDVLETGPDSKLGISFLDKSVFSMSADARMVLDELIYNPADAANSSMVVNLVQGAFVFVTGEIAPSGNMKIDTPVATMGIRGTTPKVVVNTNLGIAEFTILPDPDSGKVGSYFLINKATGEILGKVESVGDKWVITTLTNEAVKVGKSGLDLLEDQVALDEIRDVVARALGDRTEIDGSNSFSQVSFDSSSTGDNLVGGPGGDGDGAGPDGGGGDSSLGDTDDPPIGGDDAFATDEELVLAGANVIGASGGGADVDPDGFSLHVTQVNGANLNFGAGAASVLLPSGALLLIDANGNITYDPNDAYDFLGLNDIDTDAFVYTIEDPNGFTDTARVTITLTGRNDQPEITHIATTVHADAFTEMGDTGNSATIRTALGSVTFADIDASDIHNAAAGAQSVTWTQDGGGEVLLGPIGSIALNLTETAADAGPVLQFAADGTLLSRPAPVTGQVEWTYTVAENAVDFLAAGETLEIVVPVTITDNSGVGAGGGTNETDSVTRNIVITITGTNDVPVIAIVDVTGVINDIAEPDQQTDQDDLQTGGSITFADVDLTDRPTADVTAILVSATGQGGGVLSLTQTQIDTIEAAFSMYPDGSSGANTNNGTIEWDYTIAENLVDFLGAGETVTAVFTITVDDHNGGTATQNVTIVINGASADGPNDAPVISAVDVTGAMTEGSGDLSESGSVTFADVDLTDRPVASEAVNSITAMAQDGVTPLALTEAQIAALDAAFSIVNVAGNTNDGTVTWDYTIAEAALDFLGEGEVVTAVFTITVTDDEGATDTQDVTVTITGTNDAPVVAAANVIGEITELVTPAGDLTDTGTIAFSDVDLTDVHDIDPVITALPGALGSLTASVTTDTTGSGLGGVITWDYSVPASAVEYLAKDQTKVETFTITLDDGNGGTVERTITVTITGTNDAPVVASILQTDLAEQTDTDSLTVNIAVSFSDVDLNDTGHTAAVSGVAVTGETGGLALDETALKALVTPGVVTKEAGSADGSVTLAFSAASTAFDYLAVGEVVTLTYTLDIDDLDGGLSQRTFVVEITGTNDAPVAVGEVFTGDADLATIAFNNGLSAYAGDGQGDFATLQTFPGSSGLAISSGDFDSDGFTDLVVGGPNGTASRVYHNNGDGTFTDSGQVLGTSSVGGVTVGDVDGDNHLDIVTAGLTDQVWLNDGTGVFFAGQAIPTGANHLAVALGDVDGDGDLDLVTAGGGGGPSQVLLNDGSGVFADSGQVLGAVDVRSQVLADFDGDGDLDLFQGTLVGADSVWFNDGQGVFTDSGQSLGAAGDTFDATAGDFDSDGDLDLATVTYAGQPGRVYLNDGNGGFADSGQALAVPADWTTGIDAADVDGDGDLDLFLAVESAASRVFLNDGDGNFTDSGQSVATLQGTRDGVLADFDHDGFSEDIATTLRVLDNDGDVDGDSLTISAVDTASVLGAAVSISGDGRNVVYDPTGAAGLQALAEGETTNDSFTYTVSDGNGGTDTATATITVAGTNDAPELTVDTTGAVTEDMDVDLTGNLTASGNLGFTDVDATDLHSVTVDYKNDAVWSGGILDAGQIAAITAGFSADADSWDYSVANAGLQFLGEGETITLSFDVAVTDDSGAANASDTRTVTLTLNGAGEVQANLAPVVNLWAGGVYEADQTPQPLGLSDIEVNDTTAEEQQYPSVAALSDGGFVVVWSSMDADGDSWGVFGQRFDANGVKVEGEFQVNSTAANDQSWASVAAIEGGGFVVTWATQLLTGGYDDINAQRFDAGGDPVGSEFPVATTATAFQTVPHVATLFDDGDGGFLITWTAFGHDGSSWGVFGQRYAADGTPDGTEFQINTHFSGAQESTSAAGFADGGFVVVWQSDGQDGSNYGIFGQRFYADGTTNELEFIINTQTALDQIAPSVTVLESGGYVVAWASQSNFSSGLYDIAFRIYDANGDAVGNDYRIHETYDFDRNHPNVVALEDGGFLVTWSSYAEDGSNYGIYGQRFDAIGDYVGDEFRVNETTEGSQVADTSASGEATAVMANGNVVSVWSGTGAEEVFARILTIPRDGQMNEGLPFGLNIGAFVPGEEAAVLAIEVEGLPDGFEITDGDYSETSDGSPIDVSDWDLSSLLVTPSQGFTGPLTFVVNASYDNGQGIVTGSETMRIGTGGNDNIQGTTGDDWVAGLGGNDVIAGNGTVGLEGWDVLRGGKGDDSITLTGQGSVLGDEGNDWLRGVSGGDPEFDFAVLDYSSDPNPVIANLTDGIVRGIAGGNLQGSTWVNYVNDGYGGTDTVGGFHVLTGSQFDDAIYVDETYLDANGSNWIEVRPGGGDDYIEFDGVLTARISYRDAPNGVLIDMSDGYATDMEGQGDSIGNDTFTGATQARGSNFDDEIYGSDDGDQRLRGAGGDDLIDGGHGDDRLEGEVGDDILIGSDGADTLIGGLGADTFVFGALPDIDTVLDFAVLEDTIDLHALLSAAFNPLVSGAEIALVDNGAGGSDLFVSSNTVAHLDGVAPTDTINIIYNADGDSIQFLMVA